MFCVFKLWTVAGAMNYLCPLIATHFFPLFFHLIQTCNPLDFISAICHQPGTHLQEY